MFKRIFLIVAALVFAFGILTASVYKTSAQMIAPDLQSEQLEFEVTEGEEATESVEELMQEAKKPVEYDLHWGGTIYPGVLPDHFLYKIKMIRDRIWLFLTTNPLKKAELLLKLADKRLLAAQQLVDKGKNDLAVTTITKAEKYLERAVNQEKVAREKGIDTAELLQRLSGATLKHEEVLLDVREKVGDPAKPLIDSALEYSRRGYQQVMEVLGQ